MPKRGSQRSLIPGKGSQHSLVPGKDSSNTYSVGRPSPQLPVHVKEAKVLLTTNNEVQRPQVKSSYLELTVTQGDIAAYNNFIEGKDNVARTIGDSSHSQISDGLKSSSLKPKLAQSESSLITSSHDSLRPPSPCPSARSHQSLAGSTSAPIIQDVQGMEKEWEIYRVSDWSKSGERDSEPQLNELNVGEIYQNCASTAASLSGLDRVGLEGDQDDLYVGMQPDEDEDEFYTNAEVYKRNKRDVGHKKFNNESETYANIYANTNTQYF